MSPALAGRVLSTTPSGKSRIVKNYVMMKCSDEVRYDFKSVNWIE